MFLVETKIDRIFVGNRDRRGVGHLPTAVSFKSKSLLKFLGLGY